MSFQLYKFISFRTKIIMLQFKCLFLLLLDQDRVRFAFFIDSFILKLIFHLASIQNCKFYIQLNFIIRIDNQILPQSQFAKKKMSNKPKAGGKDKKKDGDSQVDKLFQQQKRQILEQSFTIKKLQDRLSRLTEQNYQVISTKDKFHADYEQKIDKNIILIESHQNTIRDKSNKIYELQVERINIKNKVNNLQRDLRQSQAIRSRQFDQYKRLTQNQMTKLENQLKQYNFYMSERDQMENQNDRLKRTLEGQKQSKVRQVADKQRQKVQATDKLRDQMLTKIRDMRTNLLSLKKQQLSTTTRLAVLQNHQLTSQLQFQSKQSQKLIFQNQNLTKKVTNLQKDLQIHKQIQQELAKRSHYSRGIIKKLTTKIGELQQELQSSKNNGKGGFTSAQQAKGSQIRDSSVQQSDRKQQMIKALDKSLEYTQKKYVKLQTQMEKLTSQNKELKPKLQSYEKKNEELLALLSRYYDQFLVGTLQLKNHQDDFVYDFKSMRKKKVQEWLNEEVRLIVLILLNKLAYKLNRKLLGIPIINKNNLTVEDDDDLIHKIKFPRISQHSAISKLGTTNINISSSTLDIRKLKDLPINMASKVVASNVREWGRTVHANSVSNLSRKYKIAER